MKKTRNKWCEYQKRSKFALRLFSVAYQTIIPRESHMIHPVTPGPVVKLVNKKKTILFLVVSADTMARLAKLTMWATVWTKDQKTIDQAAALWKVMFLSKGMISFKGVRRKMEMKFLQTGSNMKATST